MAAQQSLAEYDGKIVCPHGCGELIYPQTKADHMVDCDALDELRADNRGTEVDHA